MHKRVYNFNPGPSTLPLRVLEQAKEELLNYQDTGMSVMEISHRSKQFEKIVEQTEAAFKNLAGVGDDYRVLFIQGGASLQFDMVPLNFLGKDQTAAYVLTGGFAEKAYQEAQKIGATELAASTKDADFCRIPRQDELVFSKKASYVHITTNNTIYGTQWHYIPDTGNLPLMADMSSDILSRPLNYSSFDLVYAGAQKNLGPSGVTVVLIRQNLLDKAPSHLPAMLRYDTFSKNNSLYNTPPTFGIYMVLLVLNWIKETGGLAAIGRHNESKAGLIYDAIDNSEGFYTGHADKDSRSIMNITFRLPGAELDASFAALAAEKGLVGLKGYRSVGGIRASVYNAMSKAGCEALAEFMDNFRKKNR